MTMGWIFGSEKIDSLKESLNKNISKFTEWISYFQQKNKEQDNRLAEIERKLSERQDPDQIQYVFSRINDLEGSRFGGEERSRLNYVYQKIHELEQKGDSREHISVLSNNQMHILNKIRELEAKLENSERRPVQQNVSVRSAHEKIVKKVVQKSKDYIKNSVLNLIKKYENITGSQLKEIIVEEQGLCSKSSFYRILDEIEQEEKIKSERNGREKVYKLVHVLK